MAFIQQLDPQVANLIAAGEVVERPASVVKELMENAVDAGATQLTVEIQHGGMTLIRVTDNGCGIAPDEAETAFLRHATSKLRTAQDLEAIGTLGFRGEALCAIAAVSRVSLFTRTPDAPFGISLTLEGGDLHSKEEAGCPLGSTFVVRDLFFNTPARMKFMKRDAAEGAAVFSIVQKLALSHPEVSIKFLRDGRQELLTPGDGKAQSALYSVLGREIALGFLPVQGSGEDISVSGFISLPVCCRGTRAYQHFFLNGRQIHTRLLSTALESAYENQKMVGKFPGCVLYLNTKLNAVDVNVHPAKTEVKFLSEKRIFDAVYHTVLPALTGSVHRPAMTLQTVPVPRAVLPSFQTAKPTFPLRESAVISPAVPVPTTVPPISQPPDSLHRAPAGSQVLHRTESVPVPETRTEQPPVQLRIPEPTPVSVNSSPSVDKFVEIETEIVPWRMVGEILHTYILVEQGETFYLIDKHAAHERMHFDRMKAEGYQPMVQSLLTPIVLTPAPEEGTALLAQLPLLSEFGFTVEELDGGSLIVREVPFDLDPTEVKGALDELGGSLLAQGKLNPSAARDTLLHTMACKAAIKGGQTNAPEELLPVVEAVMSGQVQYCPHGRPVAIAMTRAQLERQFKR